MSILQQTPVVTAFLSRGGRVLVVRRSGRVGAYRGKWSGIKGYRELHDFARAALAR